MRRAIACLTLGSLLWLLWGAVRGVQHWQISANGYLVSLALGGALLGLVTAGRHLATGAWLVAPGVGAVVFAGPGGHPDAVWWLTTLTIGGLAAAGAHRLGNSVRALAAESRLRRLVPPWRGR